MLYSKSWKKLTQDANILSIVVWELKTPFFQRIFPHILEMNKWEKLLTNSKTQEKLEKFGGQQVDFATGQVLNNLFLVNRKDGPPFGIKF